MFELTKRKISYQAFNLSNEISLSAFRLNELLDGGCQDYFWAISNRTPAPQYRVRTKLTKT